MTILDEKNKALEEEMRRLKAERLRLERDNPGHGPSRKSPADTK
jgi:hypothetical protein